MKNNDIKKMFRDLDESGGPEDRRRLMVSSREEVKKRLEKLHGFRNMIVQEFRDWKGKCTGKIPHPDAMPMISLMERASVAAKRIAAVAAVLVDFPLSFWVWTTGSTLSKSAALLVSVIMGVGIAVSVHFGLSSFAEDRNRPKRSIRICRTTALWAAVLSTISGLLIFFARYAPIGAAPALELMLPGSVWLLSICLPTFSGAIFSWSYFENWEGKIERLIDNIDRDIHNLERAGSQLDHWDDPGPPPGVSMAVGVIILALAVTSSANAQTMIPENSANHHPASATAPGGPCEFWVDRSGSVSQPDLADALSRIVMNLDQYTDAMGCKWIRTGDFSDKGRFSKYTETAFPKKPIVECDVLTDRLDLFKSIRDSRLQRAELDCSTRRDKVYGIFLNDRSLAIKKAREFFKNKNPDPDLRCTDIIGLILARLHQAVPNTSLLIVSDGISDCSSEVPKIEIPPTVRIIMILIPSNEKAISYQEKWIELWRGLALEILLLPYPDFTASRISSLTEIESNPNLGCAQPCIVAQKTSQGGRQ